MSPGFRMSPGFLLDSRMSPGFPDVSGIPDVCSGFRMSARDSGSCPGFPDVSRIPDPPGFPDVSGIPDVCSGFPVCPGFPDASRNPGCLPGIPDVCPGFPDVCPGFPDVSGIPGSSGIPMCPGFRCLRDSRSYPGFPDVCHRFRILRDSWILRDSGCLPGIPDVYPGLSISRISGCLPGIPGCLLWIPGCLPGIPGCLPWIPGCLPGIPGCLLIMSCPSSSSPSAHHARDSLQIETAYTLHIVIISRSRSARVCSFDSAQTTFYREIGREREGESAVCCATSRIDLRLTSAREIPGDRIPEPGIPEPGIPEVCPGFPR